MKDVVIFGAGGLGCLVLDTLLQSERYRPAAFLDNDPRKHGTTVDGLPVLGDFQQISKVQKNGVHAAIVAIGDNAARVLIAEELERCGFTLISAIHPLASIAPSARLGKHLIIGSRVTVCVHANVADHCVLLAGAIVEHDNKLGRGVFLHPAARLAGAVEVDDRAVIGIGACIIPCRKVGREARVEPGAVVIRDVLPGTVVGGAPAVRVDGHDSYFVVDRSATENAVATGCANKPLADEDIHTHS